MFTRGAAQPAIPATFDEPAILIKINREYRPGISEQELYEATRGTWHANGPRRDRALYAMAVYEGIIQEVYRIDSWHPAGTTPYYIRPMNPADADERRYEFVGSVADAAVRSKYVGKSVAHLYSRGAQNPIKYVP